jgi:transposase
VARDNLHPERKTAIRSVGPDAALGLTVKDVARRFRVGASKVRGWIARGELAAINTADIACGKPRWVITPDALTAFEKRRQGGEAPKPATRRKTRRKGVIDYYPDGGGS